MPTATAKPSLPLAGYIRVSKVGGRDRRDGYIAESTQADGLRDWGRRRDVDVVLYPPERNVSGGTMDRPVFNSIMSAIKAGELGGIVVFKIDRFARSVYGALGTLAELGQYGGAFASCSEDISYVTAQERAFLQMQFVFAEYVRNSLAESWAVAVASAVNRGIHISSHIPFGYDRGEDRVYYPNEFADVARGVFERRADGLGWHRICSYLDREAPLPDGQRWGISKVQRMVRNRVYLGEARYGKNVNPTAHEPLVDAELFERVRQARGTMLARKPDKEPLLLGGLIRCASCRYLLKEGSSGRLNGGSPRSQTYRCNSRAVAGRCPSPQYVSRDRIEEFVVERLKERLREGLRQDDAADPELAEARRELAAADAELSAFTRNLETAARLRKLGQYDDALEVRMRAVEEATEKVERLAGVSVDGLPDLGDSFDIEKWWDAASPRARQSLMASAIDVVFVRGPGKGALEDRVLIAWKGYGPDDLPRRGKPNGPLRPYEW